MKSVGHIKKVLLSVLLFFAATVMTLGQGKFVDFVLAPKSSRLVWSVNFNPTVYLYQKNIDKYGQKLSYAQNENEIFGIRIERYSPLNRIDFGFDLNFDYNNFDIVGKDGTYRFNEPGIDFSPFVTWKTGRKIQQTKHWFVNAGITNKYLLNRTVSFKDGEQIKVYVKHPDVRKFRMNGFLGFGLILDKIYSKKWSTPRPFAQEKVYLGLNFPFFNQSYIFDYNVPNNIHPLEDFHGSKFFPYMLFFSYTRNIDLFRNANYMANQIVRPFSDNDSRYPCCSSKKSYQRHKGLFGMLKDFIVLPLVMHQVKDGSFICFYQRITYYPRIDSLSYDLATGTKLFTRVGSASFSGGISYHFWSNRHTAIYGLKEPMVYRDAFFGIGFTPLRYLLETKDSFAKALHTSLNVHAGLRAGIGDVYFTIGGRYFLPQKDIIFIDGENEFLKNFSGLSNYSLFFGFGFRNSISFGLEFRKLELLELSKKDKFINHIGLYMGFGL